MYLLPQSVLRKLPSLGIVTRPYFDPDIPAQEFTPEISDAAAPTMPLKSSASVYIGIIALIGLSMLASKSKTLRKRL